MRGGKILRTVGAVLLLLGVTTGLGVLVVRDQISRHRRDLFSSRPLRRLAALGYIAGGEPSVDSARLLRDYIQWERQPLIRRRAQQVLGRIEKSLSAGVGRPEEAAG